MPLIKSSSDTAFKSNLKAEMAAGKPQKQALAIAYDVKRRSRAMGGLLPSSTPPFIKNEAKQQAHAGPIGGIGHGRNDIHKMSVTPGSYVLPADHVSALGQGNTAAGMATVKSMFSGGPYGTKVPKMGKGKLPQAPRKKFEEGGMAEGEEPVPIIAASGEYVLEPEIVAEIGGGDMEKGHKILDKWVLETRKKHIKTLKRLPPPAKD